MKLKLRQIKRKILSLGVTRYVVRKIFGDLRFRKTWERAYVYYVGKNNIVGFTRKLVSATEPKIQQTADIVTRKPVSVTEPKIQQTANIVTRQLVSVTGSNIQQTSGLSALKKTKPRLSKSSRKLLFEKQEYQADEAGQLLLFSNTPDLDSIELPDPDDYINDYQFYYDLWASKYPEYAEALEEWGRVREQESIEVEKVECLSGVNTPIYQNNSFVPIVDERETSGTTKPSIAQLRLREIDEETERVRANYIAQIDQGVKTLEQVKEEILEEILQTSSW